MRNLEKVYNECLKELDSIGIPYGKISDICINNRITARWGQCKKNDDGTFSIEIRAILVDETRADEFWLKNTIIHEILHTINGCFNHGCTWKGWASFVNDQYGYNISRVTSAEEMGIEDDDPRLVLKYGIKCKKCGKEYLRARKTKIITNYTHYRCGVCGGKLKLMTFNK